MSKNKIAILVSALIASLSLASCGPVNENTNISSGDVTEKVTEETTDAEVTEAETVQSETSAVTPAEDSSSPNPEDPVVTTTAGSSNSSGFQGHRVKLSQDNFTNSGGSTSNGTYNPADYNDLYATSSSNIHQRADGVWIMDMGPNRDMDKEIEGFKREGGYEILLDLGVRIPCTQDPYINASNLCKVLNAKDQAQYGRDIWTVSSDGMFCENVILKLIKPRHRIVKISTTYVTMKL